MDTGSTWNILNAEIEEGKLIEQGTFEPSNILECPLFVLGEKEFGPIKFHHIPIQLPIHVEAILGMEFFNKNLVFFDFTNNMLYFSPRASTPQASSGGREGRRGSIRRL